MEEPSQDNIVKNPTFDNLNKKIAILVLGAVLIYFFSYFSFLRSPANFPVGSIVNVEQGMSLREVSLKLKQEHIIRSRLVFEASVIIYGAELSVNYGHYLFDKKLPVYEVARRLASGEHHLPQVKVVIPEGMNVSEIAEVLDGQLKFFNKGKFLSLATPKEGYLFPDTYFFLLTDNEDTVIKLMGENFAKKIEILRPEIEKVLKENGRDEKEIIIMASIIEREAKGDADREIISGILWKRIDIGMPLQADAAPVTYKKRGLPGTPIGNPGLLALRSAIYSKSSPYLYYLHDKSGNIHYAKNFTEHQANIKKYLK